MYSGVGTPASGTSASRLRCSQWGGGAPSGDLHDDTAGKLDRSVCEPVSIPSWPPSQGRCMDPVIEPFVNETVTDTVTATATKSLKDGQVFHRFPGSDGAWDAKNSPAGCVKAAHESCSYDAFPDRVHRRYFPCERRASICIGPIHSGALLPVRFEQYCNGSKKSRWGTKSDKATALVICLTRVNGGQPQRRYLQDSRIAGGDAISDLLHQVGLKFATQVAVCLEHRQLQSSQKPPPRLLVIGERDSGQHLVRLSSPNVGGV
ncbi:uncharacterized protein BDZ83DRAFT_653094 [Colletotrichum acutatum]|uniref:Uncharacterized protein n=1 Tax=Glomerella acutata TaxID=27357 RepID=A0AAD8UKY9_GLOAC|nr:uncharacterized protein BDZ83DRAFT_653094 [Colletotrichum acutatum]KAK1723443.1 hypothetical protein BDZ83DRAFT_653094 [Colletotrichum acutatum]